MRPKGLNRTKRGHIGPSPTQCEALLKPRATTVLTAKTPNRSQFCALRKTNYSNGLALWIPFKVSDLHRKIIHSPFIHFPSPPPPAAASRPPLPISSAHLPRDNRRSNRVQSIAVATAQRVGRRSPDLSYLRRGACLLRAFTGYLSYFGLTHKAS